MIPMPVLAGLLFAVRLSALRRFRALPLRNGPQWFLSVEIPAGHAEAVAALLADYRRTLFLPFALDILIAVPLALGARWGALMALQFVLMIATSVFSNVLAAHFAVRAAALVGTGPRPTVIALVMEPRRLRDHTWVLLEAATVGLLAYAVFRAVGTGPALGRALAWILWMQLGLVLLKVVFVRWRMPLPVARTDDFRRWRAAWLAYHVRILDAMRLTLALTLAAGVAWRTGALENGTGLVAGAVVMLVALAAWATGQRRALDAVAAEVRPHELAREFPVRPVAEGRYLANGLLFVERDHPSVLVRGAQGTALNVAHPATWAWIAYGAGLTVLTFWSLAR